MRWWRRTLKKHRSPSALLLPFFYRSDLGRFTVSPRLRAEDRGLADEAERSELKVYLEAMRSRLRWQRGAIVLVRASLLASLLLLLGALSYSAGLMGSNEMALGVALTLITLSVGLSLVTRLSYLETAKIVDRQNALKERLATAVELGSAASRGYLARAQTDEARTLASRLNPGTSLPWHWPLGDLKALAVALLLVAGISMLNARGWTLSSFYPLVQHTLSNPTGKMAGLSPDLGDKPPWDQPGHGPQGEGTDDVQAEGTEPGKISERVVSFGPQLGELDRAGLNAASQALAHSLQDEDYDDALSQLDALASGAEGLTIEEKQELAAALRQAASSLGESNPELAEKLSNLADALSSDDEIAQQQALKELRDEMDREDGSDSSGGTEAARQQEDQRGSQPGEGQGEPGKEIQRADGASEQGEGRSEQGEAQAGGAGDQAGTDDKVEPRRLGGEGEKLALQSERRQGRSDFQRLNPATPRTGDTQALESADADMESSQPLGIAPDSNYVPWNLKDLVKDYFSVEEGR